jgi:hypothetical protein
MRYIALSVLASSLLLEECQVAARYTEATQMTNDQYADAAHCLGYLNGIMDAYADWDTVNTRRHANNPSPACLPSNINTQELAMVVVKFLNDHPDKLHDPYYDLVTIALSEAYPCEK